MKRCSLSCFSRHNEPVGAHTGLLLVFIGDADSPTASSPEKLDASTKKYMTTLDHISSNDNLTIRN